MKNKLNEIRVLLKNKDNLKWAFKEWISMLVTWCGIIWGLAEILSTFYSFGDYFIKVKVVILVIVCIAVTVHVFNEIHKYSRMIIPTERPGCNLEIRVTDSYITNAFKNYPKSAMVIGINKCFWFREAEPHSLVEDLWKAFEEHGVRREKIQQLIDEKLQEKLDSGEDIIDDYRSVVQVRRAYNPDFDDPSDQNDFIMRNNYKIGTVIGITIKGDNNFMRELYLIANAEIVRGKDLSEPIKVAPYKYKSVVTTYENIWNYFEQDEQYTTDSPRTILYSPLLIPIIGAGVANEGYSDLEMFSELVDLYFEHIRCANKDEKPAIPNMIINIRDNTAISAKKTKNGRFIDLKTAKLYAEYRSKVRPISARNHCKN